MTKKQYLEELKRELENNNVEEIEDILSEYEEHFAFKAEEGFTEEEIAKKLSSPKDIAKEYASCSVNNGKSGKTLKVVGLSFLSVPLACVYILMWASVIALGGFAVACLALGVSLITSLNIAGLIPYMPYFPSLVLGIACLGLSVLSAVGTYYMFAYVKQWGKAYIKRCKNVANGVSAPSASMHPALSKKLSFKLKLFLMIGLVCFVVFFVVGYASLCIAAKSFEPWHVWNWFM